MTVEEVQTSDEDAAGATRALVTRVGSVEYTEAVEHPHASREVQASTVKPMGKSHRSLQLRPASSSLEDQRPDPDAGTSKITRSFLAEPLFPDQFKPQPSSKGSPMTKTVRSLQSKPVSTRSDLSQKPDKTKQMARSVRTFLAEPITTVLDDSKSFEKEPDKSRLLAKAARALLAEPAKARSSPSGAKDAKQEIRSNSVESPNPRAKSLRTFLANPVLVGPVKPGLRKSGSGPYRALVDFEAENEEETVDPSPDGKNFEAQKFYSFIGAKEDALWTYWSQKYMGYNGIQALIL